MAYNASSVLFDDAWAGYYISQAQMHFNQTHFKLPSTNKLILLGLMNVPIIVVLLNALWQLVAPRDPSLPPVVFHWLPIIGSAASYGNNPIDFFFKCRQKYGDVFTFIMVGKKVTVALGSKGNNFIFGGRTAQLSAEQAYTHLTTPVFGKGVVYDCPNDVLMEQKRFVKFGLQSDNFRLYVDQIEDEVTQFMASESAFRTFQLNDINEWGTFNAFKTMSELTILTAARTLQGREVRENMDTSFAQMFHDLDMGFTPINFVLPDLPFEYNRKRDKAHKEMSDFYVEVMRKRKEGLNDHEHDMLAALAEQEYKDGRILSEREIAHIMIALLMAGQHTSAATSAWALLHLAQKPEFIDAIYEEQVKHFSMPDGKLRSMAYEDLKDLPVLDAVIRETLRMHPPLHSIFRKVLSDIPVPPTLSTPPGSGGKRGDTTYVVPAGHYVLACPAVSQMDPMIWEDAASFNVFRWLDPKGVAAQASKTYETGEKVDYGFGAISKGTESPYLPFGGGRHRCIGEQFAYVQLMVIIATIVRKIELRLDISFPPIDFHNMIASPKGSSQIRYRRRAFD